MPHSLETSPSHFFASAQSLSAANPFATLGASVGQLPVVPCPLHPASGTFRHFQPLLGELGYLFDTPSLLLADNQSAIQVVCNPEHHGCLKLLDLFFFWLCDKVNCGVIALCYIHTTNMTTDLLTNMIACVKVAAALSQLCLTVA
jgi:hypothetical protein